MEIILKYQSEAALIDAFRSGDKEAFSIIFDRHWEELMRYAGNTLESQDDAEDLVQELFLNLWEKHHSFPMLQNDLRTYLFASLRKKILKLFRDKGVKRKHLENLILTYDRSENPVKDLMYDELIHTIKSKLSSLPYKEQQVFILHELEGYSTREISEMHQVSEQTVRNQAATANKKLSPFLMRLLTSCYQISFIAKFMLIHIFG
ncbi:RNA polymerase sigma factor [Belliella kenyensis]|uniref:RNA polymerase sigma factor n=1 Tax=Belliella kenyensis TaxID=1472724 RepID=A0ABV8EMV9_9BACT|nr:sigma-70 family RNA polymerase sigma factor [Belliella kenyensis]MCH7400721.1 sigma-70 family RNA polymerase sigma factor [Belliella kenyensis]MDN3601992.1 sigma-70 family RNA polymerase sigma factor [Belliella kenyensis]